MSQESPSVPPSPQTPKELAQTSGMTTSRLAIASLVLGLLSVAIAAFFTQIPAIICGAIALRRIRNSGGQLTGRGFAITGIVTGAVGLTLLLAALPLLARNREGARRASCRNNLMQMGLVFKMFATDSPGSFWPELSPTAGQLMFVGKQIYPEYLPDLNVLVCPSNASAATAMEPVENDPLSLIDNDSYFYLGYVITTDDEMEAFAEVYKKRVGQGLPFDSDLKAPPGRGSMGTDTFFRFRDGVEQEFMRDSQDPSAAAKIQSEIPVMFDRLDTNNFNHVPGGANVLFMDGHVQFIRYRGKWPLTKRTAEIVAELDRL